jgi:hypothetical protein
MDGQAFDITASGAFDFVESRGSLAYRMKVPELGRVNMEMRLVGEKMFLRLPAALGGALSNGKRWIGVDVGMALEGEGLGALDFTRQQDPAELLRFLRAASDGVRESGTATIRGVETTRYVGRLDLRKAIEVGFEQLGTDEAERKQARRAIERLLEETGSVAIPFEVFLDDEGLVRRVKETFELTAEGEHVSMEIAMDYFDFGVDVDVRVPPAAEVFDVTGLIPSPAAPESEG